MQKLINRTLTSYQDINPQQKNTFLILHGWGQSSTHWIKFISFLPNNYRYLILDLPGFGNTQHLPNNPGLKEYSDFILSFIHKLKLKNITLLGHSFGGQIATYLTATHSKNIKHLILLSPSSIRQKTKKQKIKIFIYHQFNFLKKILPQLFLNLLIKQVSSADYSNSSPQHRSILKKIVNQDLTSLLKKISVPTTIIWGDQDKEIPYQGKFLAENIPHSQLTILYGADHNPHLLKPEKLSSAIQQSLNFQS